MRSPKQTGAFNDDTYNLVAGGYYGHAAMQNCGLFRVYATVRRGERKGRRAIAAALRRSLEYPRVFHNRAGTDKMSNSSAGGHDEKTRVS